MRNRFYRWLRGASDDELELEIQAHLAAETEEREESGVSGEQARWEARRAFGNRARVKEDLREVWAWGVVERWRKELHLAGRSFRRRPGFFLLATMALAVGMGAASGMYAIVYASLLQPLPYPDAERIVVINDQLVNDPGARNLASPGQVKAWTDGGSSFEKIGAFTDAFFTLTGGGQEAERIPALLASPGMLDVLGARASEGRVYSELDPEDGAGPLLVSEALWKRRFGAAKLSGQTLLVDGEAAEIVGILPAGFRFLDRRYEAIRQGRSLSSRTAEANQRFRYLTVLGRLRPGVSGEQAAEQLGGVARRLGEIFPKTDAERTVVITPLDEVLRGPSRARIWVAMAAVCSLLLIACLNVGSLLLGRNLARRDEMAMRLALGAGQGDIFRQMVCEALVLAGAGTVGGLVMAEFGLAFLVRFAPPEILRFGEPGISLPVIAFAGVASVVAAFGVASLPFREKYSSRGVLLGAEVALATVLLVSAGTAVRTLVRTLDADPGFQATGAVAMELSLSSRNSPGQEGREFLRRMDAELASIPGMRGVGLANRLPLGGDRSMRPVNIGAAADSARQEMVEVRRVNPGFFDAMGMRLTGGRLLSERDSPDTARVALVNQRFARRFFGSESPVGRQLFVQEGLAPKAAEIVGVVNDIRQAGLAADPQPEVYLSVFVHPSLNVTVILRGVVEPQALIPEVRRRLAGLDPTMPLAAALPLTELVHGSAAPQRFVAFVLSTFSLLALILAAVGIYGVAAFAVVRRRAEIGIRMALGAGPFDIIALVLGWVMRVVTVGIFVGALLSWGANRWARAGVAALETSGLGVMGGAAVLFFFVALVAALGPALSATLVDLARARRST